MQSFRIKSDKPISPLNFASAIKEKVVASEPKNPEASETHPTPFMLHQENPTSAPVLSSAPKEFQSAKPSLTMKVQNFYQSSPSASTNTVPKPVSIKVEMPSADMNSHKIEQSVQVNQQDAPPTPRSELPMNTPLAENQSSRVVHYSNLRTPINSIGLPKNVVEKDNILDLRKK